MLADLGLESLEERRRISGLTFLYKVLHEEVAVPQQDLGISRNTRATRGLYTTYKLHVPQTKTTELRNHFVARTIPEWNRLLDQQTSAQSSRDFRKRLTGP